ncbi:flippase-like domain-containing protein [Mesorhizobium microcysteis]|uniref:Flippase-like domain-containing protein n=1 Tax=Neoaquamicrobium microcysteis TaxID=2682781 RepID=A0A5D4H336_9HYPH|nr:lysylphosphatidylglycerol synthase transmembrane domain-containing protein [Mesorhizobium microcysteis]TYR33240.1 flippase-like domain-containing protein [Mesorhizobium microcysteis]
MRLLSVHPWLLRAIQIGVAVALMGLLWRIADGPDAARLLRQADPLWLAAAVAALTIQTWLSALRWRLAARQLGIVLRPGEAVREYYLAQVVNQSLPGGMVGDAGRAVRSRGPSGLLAAGMAVVFERLAGQVAMFLAMASAFVVTLAAPGGFEWPRWLVLPVAVIVLAGTLMPLGLAAATRMPGRIGRSASAFWRMLARALLARRVLPRHVLLSIGTTVANLGAFAFCAIALDAALPLVAVLALVPLILFTMLIPISISGWGLREGAAAALFPLAGATASQGLATSITFGLAFIVAVLPGAAFIGTPSPVPARTSRAKAE